MSVQGINNFGNIDFTKKVAQGTPEAAQQNQEALIQTAKAPESTDANAVLQEFNSTMLVGAQKDFAVQLLAELRQSTDNADITASDVEKFVMRNYSQFYQD